MRPIVASSLLACLVTSAAAADQTGWGQCGGNGWTGPTTCVNGWKCTFSNDWYSQCLPSTSTTQNPTASSTTSSSTRSLVSLSTRSQSITTTTSRSTSITATSSSSISRTTSSRTTTTSSVTSSSTSLPTLLPDYLWIRAVTAPNFHYYIQSTSATAVLGPNTSAGQHRISSGQLVQRTSSGSLLYANVEQRSSSTDMLLGVTFSQVQNTYGTFSFSGDSLQWTTSDITRPNPAAWYVCGANRQLFINLGQYLYGTPEGCTDHTIHYYNGATPDA